MYQPQGAKVRRTRPNKPGGECQRGSFCVFLSFSVTLLHSLCTSTCHLITQLHSPSSLPLSSQTKQQINSCSDRECSFTLKKVKNNLNRRGETTAQEVKKKGFPSVAALRRYWLTHSNINQLSLPTLRKVN